MEEALDPRHFGGCPRTLKFMCLMTIVDLKAILQSHDDVNPNLIVTTLDYCGNLTEAPLTVSAWYNWLKSSFSDNLVQFETIS